MKDTLAFQLVRELKAFGFPVSSADAPVFGKDYKFSGQTTHYEDGSDHLAVVGAAGMTPEAVKSCADHVRKALRRARESYTICEGTECKQFPGAPFVAW